MKRINDALETWPWQGRCSLLCCGERQQLVKPCMPATMGSITIMLLQVDSTSILFRGLCVRMGIATGVAEGAKVGSAARPAGPLDA